MKKLLLFLAFILLFTSGCAKEQSEKPLPSDTVQEEMQEEKQEEKTAFQKLLAAYQTAGIEFTDREPNKGELSEETAKTFLKAYLEPLGFDDCTENIISYFCPFADGAYWQFQYNSSDKMFCAVIDAKTGALIGFDSAGSKSLSLDEIKEYLIFLASIVDAENGESFIPSDEFYEKAIAFENGDKVVNYYIYSENNLYESKCEFREVKNGNNSFTASIASCMKPRKSEDFVFEVNQTYDIDKDTVLNCGMNEQQAMEVVKNELSAILKLYSENENAADCKITSKGYRRIETKNMLVSLWCFDVLGNKDYSVYVDPEIGHISSISFNADKRLDTTELKQITQNYLKQLGFPKLLRSDIYSFSDFSCVGEYFYDSFFEEYGEESRNYGVYAVQANGKNYLYFTRSYLKNL